MKPESLVLAVAGMCFGVIVGWVLATVDADRTRTQAPPAAAQGQVPAAEDQGPPQLDEARVQALTTIIKNDPTNAGAAVELGQTYFQAERFEDAIKWYEEAMRLDPKNPDASTQLGMTYFLTRGTEGTEPALRQFEHSLAIEPNHPRTLLNKGIVLWRGKQDLKGAADVWQTLVKIAPASPEAQAAQQGLQAISGAAHEDGTAQPPATNQ